MSGQRQPDADNDDLLTPDKVAALLSVSVRSVRRYAADGHLSPVHLGRNVRYRRADVERLIASGAATSGHESGHSGQRTADSQTGDQGRPEADMAGMAGVSAPEPVEASYRVTPAEIEQAVSRTSVQYMGDLRTMLAEVGKVYEGQLAAKDETITAKEQVIAAQADTISAQQAAIAELQQQADAVRLREAAAAAVEANRRRLEQERRNREALEAAQEAQDAPGTPETPEEASQGLWARLGRWWRG